MNIKAKIKRQQLFLLVIIIINHYQLTSIIGIIVSMHY